MSGMIANGPGNVGSIPGWVLPKTQKMVLDATLLSTQHYMVRIKGKVEQSKEWSSTFLPLHLGVVAIKKGLFGSPSTKVANNMNILNFNITHLILGESKVLQYFGGNYYFWYIYHMTEAVQAVFGSMMVVGTLTHCALVPTVY